MSPKIERIWGTVFGQTAVKRKESAEQENLPKEKNQREQSPDDQKEDQERAADRQSVEKAMTDLRATANFSQTGMGVHMVETQDGLKVHLTHPNGSTVKVMTGEEFLKLHDKTSGEQARGKILDQKF